MLSTSARLLRLASLLQSRRQWSGPELARQLEVDARTVRRDIFRLRELGYPVQASSGLGGGYALGRGSALPPLLLDDDEAIALALALRTAGAHVGGIEATSLELLTKLEQWMPTRLRHRASALHALTLSVRTGPPLVAASMLSELIVACRDCLSLGFTYRNHDGASSRREVEPGRLANYGRRWYLIAWDTMRCDWRSFRVDRIEGALSRGDVFAPRSLPADVATRLERGIACAVFRCRITLRVQGGIGELQAALPVWCGVLEAESATHCLLHVGADSPEALLAQVLMVGREVELVDGGEWLPGLTAALQRMTAVFVPAAAR